MSLTSPSTLLLAAALTAPTAYSAATEGGELTDVLLRYLICVPIAALMLAALRSLTRSYGPAAPQRRATDGPVLDGVVETDPPR
jgi:hypothetical protein